ncbi:MAG TPA: hypothetical protein VMR44_06700, partial [Thermoanaerobaculia bacterium]|nr:hypothetical protein [Thermoanaerobaculia bacterium]
DEAAAPQPPAIPEPLRFAQTLLERELHSPELNRTSRRVLEELVKLLAEAEVETLRSTHRTLFAKVSDPGDAVRKAEWLVRDHFEG